MTTETKFRGGLAMSLLGLTIMTFFYFQQQDELQRCKAGDSFLQGGDIEKARLINQIDSLQTIIQEKVTPKEHFDGVTEMILDNYIDEKFLTNIFETNLFSYFWGAQAAASSLSKGGSIINISTSMHDAGAD